MIAQSFTYPLSVVTTITAVNRSGLVAARLSLPPVYSNWQDAYKYLRHTVRKRILRSSSSPIDRSTVFVTFVFQDQLKRGSSLFFRTALGATAGLPMPGTPVPNV